MSDYYINVLQVGELHPLSGVYTIENDVQIVTDDIVNSLKR
jgi:hypothetical protein